MSILTFCLSAMRFRMSSTCLSRLDSSSSVWRKMAFASSRLLTALATRRYDNLALKRSHSPSPLRVPRLTLSSRYASVDCSRLVMFSTSSAVKRR